MIDVFIAKITKKDSPKNLEDKPFKKRHPHILYSFWERPEGVIFEDKEDDEIILLLVRRHFVTNLHWLFISIVLFIVPLIFIPFSSTLSVFDFLQLPTRFIIIFIIFYYMVAFTYLFVNFITWYFNVSLITNKRIVDVNFSELVYKNVAATKLNLLQDASYSQIGVLRGLFDYGDVLMQTAGSLDNFSFPAVPKPERVVRLVEELIGKSK